MDSGWGQLYKVFEKELTSFINGETKERLHQPVYYEMKESI